jgi:hypothetical protein
MTQLRQTETWCGTDAATEYVQACRSALSNQSHTNSVTACITDADQDRQSPLSLYRLADACRRTGYPELWERGIKIAFERPHVTHECVFYRARAKMRLGDWSGWADYESRHYRPGTVTLRPGYALELRWTARAWDGREDLSNKTLLMVEEGGFGDSIQSLCFVPGLIARARRLILAVKPELATFVEHNFGNKAQVVVSSEDPDERFDRYVWSSTLPSLVPGLPKFEALCTPNPHERPAGRTRPLQIGIAWAAREAGRSIDDFALLEALFAVPNTEWYNLQVGKRVADAAGESRLQSPQTAFASFAETADFIMGLDCVVSVDTALCHLAGRLGIPTFLLLKYSPDWRWGLLDRTPWYPSVQLIRQSVPSDWSSAVKELVRRLTRLAAQSSNSVELGHSELVQMMPYLRDCRRPIAR